VKKEACSIVITGDGTETNFIELIVPDRSREELPEEGRGLAFFGNAVQYIRNHLL
jgi:hypothetical protein